MNSGLPVLNCFISSMIFWIWTDCFLALSSLIENSAFQSSLSASIFLYSLKTRPMSIRAIL